MAVLHLLFVSFNPAEYNRPLVCFCLFLFSSSYDDYLIHIQAHTQTNRQISTRPYSYQNTICHGDTTIMTNTNATKVMVSIKVLMVLK